MKPTRSLPVLAVLLLFVLACVVHHLHVPADDLSSSYLGCRVLAAGKAGHLYSHDPMLFSEVGDPLWDAIAQQSGFPKNSHLHPYVQTPLWGFLLRPLCTRTGFPAFAHLFLALMALCTAATIWLVARFWTPDLLHPGWIAFVCIALLFSEPYKYAQYLVQTHMIFVFLTVLALILARAERNLLAGLALAAAAAVKITPGFLLVYWLCTRQRKAALSFVLWSLGIVAASYALLGTALMSAYLHNLQETSNTLLLAFNNQSFAAWLLAHRYPADELFHWRIHPLPSAVKAISLVLVVLCSVAGGLLDRRTAPEAPVVPPYGALFAMVGATAFTPLAWDHYYILLVVPLMFLLEAWHSTRKAAWLAWAAAIWVLNLYPLSFNATRFRHASISIPRSQFYSGIICLVALFLLSRWQQSHRSPDFGAKV